MTIIQIVIDEYCIIVIYVYCIVIYVYVLNT